MAEAETKEETKQMNFGKVPAQMKREVLNVLRELDIEIANAGLDPPPHSVSILAILQDWRKNNLSLAETKDKHEREAKRLANIKGLVHAINLIAEEDYGVEH